MEKWPMTVKNCDGLTLIAGQLSIGIVCIPHRLDSPRHVLLPCRGIASEQTSAQATAAVEESAGKDCISTEGSADGVIWGGTEQFATTGLETTKGVFWMVSEPLVAEFVEVVGWEDGGTGPLRVPSFRRDKGFPVAGSPGVTAAGHNLMVQGNHPAIGPQCRDDVLIPDNNWEIANCYLLRLVLIRKCLQEGGPNSEALLNQSFSQIDAG
ncbi:hypothetical protein LAZ67_X000709 [Cordylochernes scorpioides]|uniref:Uncharacterized protein n=1 Tax=Cordylochernes scorpioides TaxID=51811 RepID=A0ABY6LS24_9ARAC|nr:hypothetical protein LAZ67_X000709 [Cordylochernes scorpioides]